MKRLGVSFVIGIILFLLTFGGAYLNYFHIRSEADNIEVEWKVLKDLNISKFVIERRDATGSFVELATILPKGDNLFYSYIDRRANKTSDVLFVYKLKIVDTNNRISYSNEATISLSVLSIKRAWDSIKSLFR